MARFARTATLVVVIACAMPLAASAGNRATVAGQVMGPARTIQCIRAPCLEPAIGVELAFVRSGTVVRRVRTGPGGRFRVDLAPGWYAIRGATLARAGLVDPRRFRLRAGQSLVVALRVGDRPSAASS
jgi:hypothetical protein